jgi:chemotaxis protein CheX
MSLFGRIETLAAHTDNSGEKMSAEIALVGFPRLQGQIATRMLLEHDVVAKFVQPTDAADQVSRYDLTMFFWPDAGGQASSLQAIRTLANQADRHVLVVTSAVGKRSAREVLGDTEDDILMTPIQPHDLTAQISKRLKLQKKSDPASIDVEFLNPFVEGTVATMKQMANLDCERTGLGLSGDARSKGDISGTIGLSGDAEGFVSVSFSDSLARKIIAKMLMMEEGETVADEDIQDGVGEFMNVVAGFAKAKLVDTEHSFSLSIPNVIYGGPHSVGQPRGIPVFTIDFETDGEAFHVLVCLMPKKTHAAK